MIQQELIPTKTEQFVLRDYQKTAISKVIWSMNNGLEGNDLLVLATGSGKSLIIASIVHSQNLHTIILQPTAEILEQNFAKLKKYVDEYEIGIYSASMKQKQIRKFTLATINSIYKNPELFAKTELVIIDEADEVDPKSKSTMYGKLIAEIKKINPKLKVIGLTATPYRLDQYYIAGPYGMMTCGTCIKMINRHYNGIWNRVLFVLNMKELISMGYLAPIEYHDVSVISHSEIPLNKSESGFDEEALDQILTTKEDQILGKLSTIMKDHKHLLVFCSSVRQAEKFAKVVQNSACISSNTRQSERTRLIEEFKSGKVQVMFNVGVFTTGFDFPALDGIVLIKSTRSIALYQQMIGRGVRLSEGKDKCHVYDFSGTFKSLGKAENLEYKKDLEGKWNLCGDNGNWHGKKLYEFTFERT